MKLNVQKRLAASVAKRSRKKVSFDTERLSDIKESITKADIKGLIRSGAIKVLPLRGISRGRARHTQHQKRHGKRRSHGSRKGTANTRNPKKREWIYRIRAQRDVLKTLRDHSYITPQIYQQVYMKAKGGFFRSVRHLKLYLQERELIQVRK